MQLLDVWVIDNAFPLLFRLVRAEMRCVPSMPESITAQMMPEPVAEYDLYAASAFTVGIERSTSAFTWKSGDSL